MKSAARVGTARVPRLVLLDMEIGFQEHLEQLIPVDMPDEAAGVVVGGDIGGVLGKDVPYELVDRVITLLTQGFIHCGEDLLDFLLPILSDGEGDGRFM